MWDMSTDLPLTAARSAMKATGQANSNMERKLVGGGGEGGLRVGESESQNDCS